MTRTGGKIAHFLTDYDGTLAPADVPRADSAIPEHVDALLRLIATRSLLAVITAKNFEFIKERVPYASAWGCVFGLDLRFEGGLVEEVDCRLDMDDALEVAHNITGSEAEYELKRDSSGRLLGFALDWRGRPTPARLPGLLSGMKERGVAISYDGENPFADFLCAPPRKGYAVRRIVEVQGGGDAGGTIYLGDSPADNPAFDASDVAVGVLHGQRVDTLRCDFVVPSTVELVSFLRALSDSDMRFSPDLPGIRRRW